MDKTALTAVIAGIIVLLLAAVAVSGIRKKKRGEHLCSCGGNCGGHGSVDINALTSMIVAELKKVM